MQTCHSQTLTLTLGAKTEPWKRMTVTVALTTRHTSAIRRAIKIALCDHNSFYEESILPSRAYRVRSIGSASLKKMHVANVPAIYSAFFRVNSHIFTSLSGLADWASGTVACEQKKTLSRAKPLPSTAIASDSMWWFLFHYLHCCHRIRLSVFVRFGFLPIFVVGFFLLALIFLGPVCVCVRARAPVWCQFCASSLQLMCTIYFARALVSVFICFAVVVPVRIVAIFVFGSPKRSHWNTHSVHLSPHYSMGIRFAFSCTKPRRCRRSHAFACWIILWCVAYLVIGLFPPTILGLAPFPVARSVTSLSPGWGRVFFTPRARAKMPDDTSALLFVVVVVVRLCVSMSFLYGHFFCLFTCFF